MNVSSLSFPHRPRHGAFTLIELLTVIAIIGILAAIIIPVTGKVRDRARTTQCLSNVRQIAMANVLFANENKGIFLVRKDAPGPGGTDIIPDTLYDGNWQKTLARYMGMDKVSARSRFVCPSANMTDAQISSGNETSYNVSIWLSNAPAYGRASAFAKPVVMVADIYVSNVSFTYPWNVRTAGHWQNRLNTFRHNGNTRRNVGMTDGSARTLSPIQDGVFKDGTSFLPNLWLQPDGTTSATLDPSVPTDAIPAD